MSESSDRALAWAWDHRTALVAALLWVAALFAPVRDIDLNYGISPFFVGFPFGGWRLALFGWLGPLVLAPGWFANLLLAKSLYRMFKGTAPGKG
jgi:hypothetical protein